MLSHSKEKLIILVIASIFIQTGFAAEQLFPPTPTPDSFESREDSLILPIRKTDLPDFTIELETEVGKSGKVNINGLLATVNYDQFPKRKPKKNQKIKVHSSLTGFPADIKVRIFMRKKPAPLAVTLLGFGQPADDHLSRAWQKYLCDSGCHVLSFDSVVLNSVNESTQHGVAGNPPVEAVVVGKIIDGFLNSKPKNSRKPYREKITSVRLLGTSYGGYVALHCLKLKQASQWPIDRVLVLSSPINIDTAAIRLSEFYHHDHPKVGSMKLFKLLGGYTPKSIPPNAEDEALMRAGLGFIFHWDLEKIAESNVKRYIPDLLKNLKAQENSKQQKALREKASKSMKKRHEKEWDEFKKTKSKKKLGKDEYERQKKKLKHKHKVEEKLSKRKLSDIDDWNFKNYIHLLNNPYWESKNSDVLPNKLSPLIKETPAFVQVILTADDPLNDPEEFRKFQKAHKEPKLIVLPHGGHLGFGGTNWIRLFIKKFFDGEK